MTEALNNNTTTQATPPKNQIDIQDVEYYRLQTELRLCNGKYAGVEKIATPRSTFKNEQEMHKKYPPKNMQDNQH